MATLRNRRKLAAASRETSENTRHNQSLNTFSQGMVEEYITQFPEELVERVTKKLSQDFGQMESRTLDALSKLDEFLLNPQVRTCSGTVSETSGITTQETVNPLNIVPRLITTSNGSSLFVKPALQLTQTKRRLLTW